MWGREFGHNEAGSGKAEFEVTMGHPGKTGQLITSWIYESGT